MAKQLTADEESILKRQARRRLIGAVALTTAVVVILPLVFDSEPPASVSNNIELSIAGQEKAKELPVASAVPVVSPVSAVVDVPIAIPAPIPVVSTMSAVAPASAVVAPAQKPETVKFDADKTIKTVNKQIVTDSPEERAKTEAKPKIEEKSKVEAKTKTEVKPKAEIKPKAESKAAALPRAVPHSGYVIQIGAYSNHAAAKNMQERLAKQGFRVYTEKIGENVRVRVGSFPTREAAEKIRHKLEALKLHPNLVNLGG